MVVVSGIIGAYKGFTRGISRQVIRSVTVIAAALLSIYLVKLSSNALMVRIGNSTPDDIIGFFNFLHVPIEDVEGLISYLDTETINYVLAIPLALFISPVLFVACFLLIKLVMLIPHVILSGIFGFSKRRNNVLTRTLGMVLGAVQGVVVAALIIFPIAGALTATSTVVYDMQNENPDDEATATITDFYNDKLKSYAEEPLIKVIGNAGGKQLYETLATVRIGDKEYAMVETVSEPAVSIGVGINKLWGCDWKKPTPENEDAIKAMVDSIEESEYSRTLIADVCVFASHAYRDGEIPLELEAQLSDVVDATFESIGMITPNTLGDDLDTLTDAYFVLARENVIYAIEFGNSEEIQRALKKTYVNDDDVETTVVNEVVGILNSNEHTVPLVTVITKLSIASLADQLNTDADISVLYGSVKDGVNETVKITKEGKTEEEYKAEVTESLNTVLKENGIEIEEEVVDGMAQYISDNYEELHKSDTDGDGQLSDQEMNDIVLSYYDSYIDYINSQEQE